MTLEQKMADKYDDGEKIGIQKGERKGLKKGIQGTVEILKKIGRTDQKIMEDITDQYQLTRTEAKRYLK